MLTSRRNIQTSLSEMTFKAERLNPDSHSTAVYVASKYALLLAFRDSMTRSADRLFAFAESRYCYGRCIFGLCPTCVSTQQIERKRIFSWRQFGGMEQARANKTGDPRQTGSVPSRGHWSCPRRQRTISNHLCRRHSTDIQTQRHPGISPELGREERRR